MIALDTNVLVRIITRDDARQANAAARAMREDCVFLAKSVILELEWALRYSYDFDRQSVNRALLTLLGLENAVVEDAANVEDAVRLHAQGMDFADALHVASSSNAEAFVTFDQRLAAAGRDRDQSPAIRLLE